MLLTNQAIKNAIYANQWKEIQRHRQAAEAAEKTFGVNAGLVPRDVYQDMERDTVQIMRSDDGDAFLNDLIPRARGINIGKLTTQYRQGSDAGNVQTSMSGQVGTLFDQVDYKYDGAIVPIQTAGYFRQWRELESQRSEGFDALLDDNRETVRSMRIAMADSFLDGFKDKNGNFLVQDGLSWTGMRNDTARVAQVDLGAGGLNFDFTDVTKTGAEIKAAFIQIRDILQIDNNCSGDSIYYLSREIVSNFERRFSAQYDSTTILQELTGLMGVSSFKPTNKLTGNELMALPATGDMVRPVSGMMTSTIALPRLRFNDNYEFMVWHATGWQVKTDYNGQKCALYAAG
jgi:hypothetical protein